MRMMSKNLNSDITKLITRYLSIREHSRLELKNKLTDKGYHPRDISEAIDEFALKDIQSDTRFTEEFIRSRLKKNKGPRLIAAELVARGISDNTVNKKLSEVPDDKWLNHTVDALSKKLKSSAITINDKVKIYSFLTSRGFENKMIKYAIDECQNEC